METIRYGRLISAREPANKLDDGGLVTVTLSAVHEGYLIALIAVCVLQSMYFLWRMRTEAAENERERRALQREVAQLRKDRELMEIEANRDTLTGLPNRRSFEATLAAALEELKSDSHPCALLMIDFDDFKSINDNFGHAAGDEVLKTLSAQLQELLRQSEPLRHAVFARYGGDEFSVILPGCGIAAANHLAESLRTNIAGLDLEFNGRACPLSISVGIAAFPAHTSAPEALFEQADRALYRAKSSGRNRVCEPSSQPGHLAAEN